MSIQVFDNFLTGEETEKAYEYANNSKNWKLQVSSKTHSTKTISIPFLYLNVSEKETFFHKTIFSKIKKIVREKVILQKVYINGQSSGSDGTFHHDECDKTALIYLSPYDIEWGGFTEFIVNTNENNSAKNPQIKCVAPFRSSMVVFDSDIPHKGYSFSYQHCPIRYSLAYKLKYRFTYS
tara:strand:+ start:228 stop:767 length:540 start_codon:yes stop_codon:yes gene_type:complete